MDLRGRMSFFNILAFSVPLFCLLLSWASSSTTTFLHSSPAPGPPSSSSSSSSSSIVPAAETLRARGYSLFSSAIISTFSATASPDFSATILAAPDFLFAFSPGPSRRALHRRPSATLLLHHTLRSPSLRWLNLTSLPDGSELPTLHKNYCLFLFKNPNGDVSISSSKKPISAVNIRQPDLYADKNLVIHGIDGLLDPKTGDKCSEISDINPTVEIQSAHRSFLDHAIRVLRRRGFHVAASALAARRPELLALPAVTVFVPSDKALFSNSDGFRYDVRRHVVAERLNYSKLMMASDGMEFATLAPNKAVFIQSGGDAVSVNGVRIDGAELYHNRWIILYSIPVTLDDVVAKEFLGSNNRAPSSPEIDGKLSGDMSKNYSSEQVSNGVPTAAPQSSSELTGPPAAPPPESGFLVPEEIGVPGVPPVSVQDNVEDTEFVKPLSPSPSTFSTPAVSDAASNQCDAPNLICAVDDVLDMQGNDDVQTFPAVAPYDPFDYADPFPLSKKLLQSELLNSTDGGKKDPDHSNVAGDLFYYT